MDLYVERQCVEQMKAGDTAKFLLLFEANFSGLYKYVRRRVADSGEVDKIVQLTFLDALGQIQSTPVDVGYNVWLYSLAKPRVWSYLAKNPMIRQGVVYDSEDEDEQVDSAELRAKAENMFSKLSLEEREILRLKFFEEVADGDVMSVLGMAEGTIGPQIYRVLKRAHFLLFGESDEGHGVYFGELSGFFARLRDVERVEIPEILKLNLKMDISGRVDRKDFAIEAELAEESSMPFLDKNAKGSDDPAKIFVEAVKEMREEEARGLEADQMKIERQERFYDFVDRWKHALVVVPVLVFVAIVSYVVFNFANFGFNFGKIARGYPTICENDVSFAREFNSTEKRDLNKNISDRVCDHFNVKEMAFSRIEKSKVNVEVDVEGWMLKYDFVKKQNKWKIQKYERITDSNQESRKVSRNIGGA